MQVPLQLTFRTMTHSDVLAAQLERRVARLEQFYDRIVSCHVVIEPTRHHHRQEYQVSIHLDLPGHEILVSHQPDPERPLETADVTADRAFDDAERQLEDWGGRQIGHRHQTARGEAKGHRPGEAP